MHRKKERGEGTCRKEPGSEREEQRIRFARAITRDAFGRHYWDDRQAEEIVRALTKEKEGDRKRRKP